MPGDDNPHPMLYIMDNSTISQIFRALYRSAFPSFWDRFDGAVRDGTITSVRHVRLELENARHPEIVQAPSYLISLNRGFFEDPTELEQAFVREMMNDASLSSAANRWQRPTQQGTEDADPYVIARARASMWPVAVVTEESQDPSRADSIPFVCRTFAVRCINLQQMMSLMSWQF